jgi:transcriptional regulator with XRE-family HTH domain
MAARQRPADRGELRGRDLLIDLSRELRRARRDRGLSLRAVALAAGISAPTVYRIERGLSPNVSLVALARLLAIVGLELGAKAFPGGQPIRDARHVELLGRLRARLHRSLRWATEVPLPIPGDQRAWDALISGSGWLYGVEAETAPTDSQAMARRIQLKQRDGKVDGVLLLLPRGAPSRRFVRGAGVSFVEAYPVPARRCLELLNVGADPGGSSLIVL